MYDYRELWLSEILDCGCEDLNLLEKYDGDISAIITRLKGEDNITLNAILMEIFFEARESLIDYLHENSQVIFEDIIRDINDVIDICVFETLNLNNGENLKEDLMECFSKDELSEKLERLNNFYHDMCEEKIKEDFTYYINCSASYVHLNDLDLYKRYFPIDKIEDIMGFEFRG